ncbi:hypothetical protein GCM10010233_44690 [Streptomyces pseudogriseolus]|uniref:Uncharacterized protein n=1 Tax=Streptomyces pseudogriseolus TaxID=36817 RepID=A0ABQ2T8U1_STREZ|nr:hypothetical protein GCM10010233_44690 [Streptomyces gancidicus]GGS54665.1 hypothetical protein GCM10010285_37840 [Streptomyces rubiginosus]
MQVSWSERDGFGETFGSVTPGNTADIWVRTRRTQRACSRGRSRRGAFTGASSKRFDATAPGTAGRCRRPRWADGTADTR